MQTFAPGSIPSGGLSNPDAKNHRRWMMLARMALVLAMTISVYWPAMHGALLWDDAAHLTRPDLQSWSGLWRILTQFGVTQEFYPVLHGAFWVEHRLWGDNLFAYHLLNAVLHGVSACLLAVILRRLWTRSAPNAVEAKPRYLVPPGTEWIAAVLFAVHPVAVESVAWITEQKNTLSLFFGLVAALAYLRYLDRRSIASYLVALLAFFVALGAKTETVCLPAALLVIAWWKRGRLEWKREVWPLVPWFVLSFVAGIVTIFVETTLVGAQGEAYALTLGQRSLLANRVIWFYLGKLVWPHELLFFYPRWDLSAGGWTGWICVVATGVLTAGLWIWRRRNRGPLAAWLLFLGTLFPVLGFFNVFAFAFSYVADHFQYLPCLVFVATAAAAIGILLAAVPARFRLGGRVVLAALVVLLTVHTYRLSARYVDNETLFRSVVVRNPSSWMAHEILGGADSQAGRIDAAIAEYREVIRLKPDHPNAHDGLALELERLPGHRAEAITEFEEAIRLRPHFAEAHYNLAVLLASDPTRRTDAIMYLRLAVGLKPNFPEAQVTLANLLRHDPATQAEALEHYAAALRYRPDLPIVHLAWADALATLPGRRAEAMAEYETTLRLEPNNAHAHFNFANLLATMPGRVAEAISHYEAALRIEPKVAGIHANLATALLEIGRPAEAVTEYEQAVKLDPAMASAHESLALLLAQTPGRADDAIAHAETAVQLQPHNPDLRNNLGMLYAQRGNLEVAEQAWRAALAVDPAYAPARQNLERLEQLRTRQRTDAR